jgi:hypothetical protein
LSMTPWFTTSGILMGWTTLLTPPQTVAIAVD